MAKINVSAVTLGSRQTMELTNRTLGNLNINNIAVNRVTQSSMILKITEQMRKRLTIEPTQTGNTNDLAYRIFTAMGCSVIRRGPLTNSKYSLMNDQIDTETVQNPNKIDLTQFGQIEKSIFDITHVFGNEDDSIFRLDSQPPNGYVQQFGINLEFNQRASELQNIEDVVELMINLGLNTKGVGTPKALQGI